MQHNIKQILHALQKTLKYVLRLPSKILGYPQILELRVKVIPCS